MRRSSVLDEVESLDAGSCQRGGLLAIVSPFRCELGGRLTADQPQRRYLEFWYAGPAGMGAKSVAARRPRCAVEPVRFISARGLVYSPKLTCCRGCSKVGYGPSPCENAKTLDCDRTSYSFNAALGAQTASPFNSEVEPENIVLVALRVFEFSHSLGQYPPSAHFLVINGFSTGLS